MYALMLFVLQVKERYNVLLIERLISIIELANQSYGRYMF